MKKQWLALPMDGLNSGFYCRSFALTGMLDYGSWDEEETNEEASATTCYRRLTITSVNKYHVFLRPYNGRPALSLSSLFSLCFLCASVRDCFVFFVH